MNVNDLCKFFGNVVNRAPFLFESFGMFGIEFRDGKTELKTGFSDFGH